MSVAEAIVPLPLRDPEMFPDVRIRREWRRRNGSPIHSAPAQRRWHRHSVLKELALGGIAIRTVDSAAVGGEHHAVAAAQGEGRGSWSLGRRNQTQQREQKAARNGAALGIRNYEPETRALHSAPASRCGECASRRHLSRCTLCPRGVACRGRGLRLQSQHRVADPSGSFLRG